MVTFYFDTSALVKRYHVEIGTDIIDKIFELEDPKFVISHWTVLEFTVALSAKVRRKELSKESFNVVVSRFLRDILDDFTITSVNDELVALATPLTVKYSLPSSDCLQLACVLSLKSTLESVGEKPVLICSDMDLSRAAQREGIRSINPEEKDAWEKLKTIIT